MVAVSVIIPAHNAAATLPSCLAALRTSKAQPLECIVVDDSSTDDTTEIARQHGAHVISISAHRGPACARNRGAAEARGNVLFFLDADVRIHSDVLARIGGAFAGDVNLDAVIGSYDDSPGDPNFFSQYRNLLHCFVHQSGHRETCTFWSGCGAIRKTAFIDAGGFDESYRRPSTEDIELSYRLLRAGRKIVLDKLLLCTHLKRWTLFGMLITDIRDRAVPWTCLIVRTGSLPNDLNVRWSQRISGVLALALALVPLAGTWLLSPRTAVAAALGLYLVIAALNLPFYRFLTMKRGSGFAAKASVFYTLYLIYSSMVFVVAAPYYAFMLRTFPAKDAWPAQAD